MKRAGLFLLCSISLHIVHAQHEPDTSLVRSLLDRAYAAYLREDIEDAAEYAEYARSFDADSPDALFLSVLPLLDDLVHTEEVRTRLESAVLQNDTEYVSSLDIKTALAFLYIRMQDYDRGYALLNFRLSDRDALLAKIICLRALKNPLVFEEISRAQRLYPDDFRFTEQSVRTLEVLDPLTVGAVLASSNRSPSYFSTLRYLIESTKNPELQTRLLQRYREQGTDVLSEVYALAVPEMKESATERLRNEALTDKFIIDRLVELRSLPDLLRIDVLQYEGTMYYDSNRDGFSEQYFTVSKGEVLEWSIDKNQDGSKEVSIIFSQGIPDVVTLRFDASEYVYDYGVYPALQRLERYDDDTGLVVFLFQQDRLKLPIFHSLPPSMENVLRVFAISNDFTAPTVEELLQATSIRYVSETRSIQLFDDAQLWMEMRDMNDDTHIDNIIYLQQGVPEFSFADKDFNGYFEAATEYIGGRAFIIDIDSDEDGYVEAVQELTGFAWHAFLDTRKEFEAVELREFLDYADYLKHFLHSYIE